MSTLRTLLILLLISRAAPALPFLYHGELATLLTLERDTDDRISGTASVRYLPQLERDWQLTERYHLLGELTGLLRGTLSQMEELEGDLALKLHRCWLRLDHPRWEMRAGLQKLSFGPARLLRVLRWFDTVDPNDPTGFTGGVTGLTLRFTPTVRSTLRGWVLLDDNSLEGIDTRSGTAAGGGRLQLPLGRGEVALTTHNRLVDNSGSETRLALDGGWDLGIGLWFESMLHHLEYPGTESWSSLTSCGLDYTFGVGDGLHLLTELLYAGSSSSFPPTREPLLQSTVVALMLDYPLSIFDNLSLVMLLDDEQRSLQMLDWGHLTDYWTIHLQLYRSDDLDLGATLQSENSFDSGVKLMLLYNH